jgi:photosystem II stability/assembly factor-like uncharacterized protein
MINIHALHKIIFMGWVTMFLSLFTIAQKIQVLDSSNKISLRGLSVVNDAVFWASGNKGYIARSLNNGEKIEWIKVAGYENRDFRDIEAINESTALIMAIDSPALILITKDGGKTWRKVFEDPRSGMFLDAMYFEDNNNGIVVGDPINGRFFLATTANGGETWTTFQNHEYPVADSGEALFAASGSNIILSNRTISFVSGGTVSHFIINNQKIKLPLLQGKSSTGANAIDRAEDGRMIIVGGDFSNDTISIGNATITDDSGKLFLSPVQSPYGYKSSICYLGNKKWIACGTSGVDISMDHGMNWKHITNQSFHVVKKAKKGKKVFLAGRNGVIAELIY